MSLVIYYDGDCYFCENYAQYAALKNVVGQVELVSLRSDDPRAKHFIECDYNVNTGFIVEHDGQIHKGAQAFAYLNSLIRQDGLLNRMVAKIGGHPSISRFLYPFLVANRYLLLGLQGRPLIEAHAGTTETFRTGETVGVRLFRLTPVALLLLSTLGIFIFPLLARFELPKIFYFKGLILTLVAMLGIYYLYRAQRPAQVIYEKIRFGGLGGTLTYLLVWLVVVNIGTLIIERRLLGLVAALPLIGITLDLYLIKRRDKNIPFVASIYPLALSLIVFVPGWVFGPYYGGIAGWTLSVDRNEPVRISGIKLINRNGKEIWHNHAFLQPHTQVGRFQLAFMHGGKRTYDDYFRFILSNYTRIYPMLERGKLPHQWALGKWAYPTHNLSKSNALAYSRDFAPSNIKSLIYVAEWYSWQGVLVKKEVYNTYDAQEKTAGKVGR